MQIDTYTYDNGWKIKADHIRNKDSADLVMLFGDSDALCSSSVFDEIKLIYPKAHIIGASSAGHILGAEIDHNPVVATAVFFEKGGIHLSCIDFNETDRIETIAYNLLSKLPRQQLKHVFVLSDGLNINGSELVRGMNKVIEGCPVTGGMAGDGDRFARTYVVANEPARERRIVAVGFYGDDFVTSHGCYAGWSEFGSDRVVTRSAGNVLYELDGEPALDLYKKYLGDYAPELPNSGMRFPLSIKPGHDSPEIIRTLLAIDEDQKSITFAGDIPEGYFARLMKPDIDVLIDGAGQAALEIDQLNAKPALGIVVSCTGRRIVLDQLIDEEIEIIQETLGENVSLTGFYSYGEIAPFAEDPRYCELHNQTMTLTAIYER